METCKHRGRLTIRETGRVYRTFKRDKRGDWTGRVTTVEPYAGRVEVVCLDCDLFASYSSFRTAPEWLRVALGDYYDQVS